RLACARVDERSTSCTRSACSPAPTAVPIPVPPPMQTILLGVSELHGSRLAYGCWRLAGGGDARKASADQLEAGRRAVMAAYEAGFTLFDHADVYCDGVAEEIFGQALQEVPGMREWIVIASKCGIRMADEPPGAP